MKVAGEYNRGILFVEEYPLYVVSEQTIPSLLFEAGYMSNYQECTDLQQSKKSKNHCESHRKIIYQSNCKR